MECGVPQNQYVVRRREETGHGRAWQRAVDVHFNGPELSWENFRQRNVLKKRVLCTHVGQNISHDVIHDWSTWLPKGPEWRGKKNREKRMKRYFETHFCRSKMQYGKWYWFPSPAKGLGSIEDNKWPEQYIKFLEVLERQYSARQGPA